MKERRNAWGFFLVYWKTFLLILVPIVLLPLPLIVGTSESRCGYMILLMAFYWVLDLMPLAATSILPVVLCPILGITSTGNISMTYMRGGNMLLLGSMIVATSIESSDLHRRIALNTMKLVGASPRMLMVSFMIPTAALSMWISDTAMTAMMIPILEAVLNELEEEDDDEEYRKKTRAMLAMTVSYSALIGGTGTIIGTPPNLLLMEFLEVFEDHPLNFSTWLGFAIPTIVLSLILIYFWFNLFFFGIPSSIRNLFRRKKSDDEEAEIRRKAEEQKDVEKRRAEAVQKMIRSKCAELGSITFQEVVVIIVFVSLLLLWFFRSPGYMTGWGDLLESQNPLGETVRIGDATPAVFMAVLLFVLPAKPYLFKRPFKSSPAILNWPDTEKRLHWGLLLLIGSGFALAKAANDSCLSAWIGHELKALSSLSPTAVAFVSCLIAAILTQITSNTASAGILLPVLIDLSLSLEINPVYLTLPPALVCSYAFMLPVSTGPNAIAFGPSQMKTVDMMKLGSVGTLLCLGVLTLCINTYGVPLFDLREFPDWATSSINATNVCGYE